VKAFVLTFFAVAVLAFFAGVRLTHGPVTATRSHLSIVAASQDSGPDENVDAYGNEVTNAVAEYTLDPAGSLYELHSPQVELPHLGSPKS
jgi:hypothetical protein